MKKMFTILAIILLAGATAWAEEPLTTQENATTSNPVFQLHIDNLNLGGSVLNYEPSFQLNESTSFGFDSYNDFSDLTKRRKKNKTAKILTFVGTGCFVVGSAVTIICAVKMVKSGVDGMEDMANDMDIEDYEDGYNNAMEGFNKTTDNMMGYWAGAAAGGVVATAGGVVATIGIIKWVRGSHHRRSELFNDGMENNLCDNPYARESMLSFGAGNGTIGFALDF